MKTFASMVLALGILGGGAQLALAGDGCCGTKKAEKKEASCCTADKSCADKSKCTGKTADTKEACSAKKG